MRIYFETLPRFSLRKSAEEEFASRAERKAARQARKAARRLRANFDNILRLATKDVNGPGGIGMEEGEVVKRDHLGEMGRERQIARLFKRHRQLLMKRMTAQKKRSRAARLVEGDKIIKPGRAATVAELVARKELAQELADLKNAGDTNFHSKKMEETLLREVISFRSPFQASVCILRKEETIMENNPGTLAVSGSCHLHRESRVRENQLNYRLFDNILSYQDGGTEGSGLVGGAGGGAVTNKAERRNKQGRPNGGTRPNGGRECGESHSVEH